MLPACDSLPERSGRQCQQTTSPSKDISAILVGPARLLQKGLRGREAARSSQANNAFKNPIWTEVSQGLYSR